MARYEHSGRLFSVSTTDEFDRPEPTLLDLWPILARHRRVLLAILAASAATGLALVVWLPAEEKISTVIEIGTRVTNAPIEAPHAVMVKINAIYIPLVQAEYAKQYPTKIIPAIKANVPKNGDVVVLESHAPPDDRAVQIQQHLDVVKLLQRDHERVSSLTRNELRYRLRQGEISLATLRGNRALLLLDERRIEEKSGLIQAEIREVERLLQPAGHGVEQAVNEVSNAPTALAHLLITNDLQQNRARLAAMKENVWITLAAERDRLRKQIDENQMDQERQKASIENTRVQIVNLQETRLIGGRPLHSALSSQLQKGAILLVTMLAGLMVGILAVIILDSVGRAHKTARPRSGLVS